MDLRQSRGWVIVDFPAFWAKHLLLSPLYLPLEGRRDLTKQENVSGTFFIQDTDWNLSQACHRDLRMRGNFHLLAGPPWLRIAFWLRLSSEVQRPDSGRLTDPNPHASPHLSLGSASLNKSYIPGVWEWGWLPLYSQCLAQRPALSGCLGNIYWLSTWRVGQCSMWERAWL